MAPHTPAICSGSGSTRNLELVQAHSLFTFMGRLADGPGGLLQQRLAERKLARRAEVSARLDGLWSAVAPAHETPVHTFAQRLMTVCFPSRTHANARAITASLSTAAGQSGSFKVTSQSTGVRAPSANRRQELARCCAHGECYLLVIVVVILCPVWQRINEQHANTFCPNICDRHIFRPASKI